MLLILHACVLQVLRMLEDLCMLLSSGLSITSPKASDFLMVKNRSTKNGSIILGKPWGVQAVPRRTDSLATPFMYEELPGNCPSSCCRFG
jgi:hypothetical protein